MHETAQSLNVVWLWEILQSQSCSSTKYIANEKDCDFIVNNCLKEINDIDLSNATGPVTPGA